MLKKNVLNILNLIIDRYNLTGNSYPFIDMKLDTITGETFPDDSASILGKVKSPDTILIWIQGRALEALAGHYNYLAQNKEACLSKECELSSLQNIRKISFEVMSKLEEFRAGNHGRMWFFFDTSGTPFTFENGEKKKIDLAGQPYNFSDLFYVKGLLASATLLNDTHKIDEAKVYFRKILQSLQSYTFRSDQVSFDPKNILTQNPEKRLQGPLMIAVGACALFADLTKEDEWFMYGFELIEMILKQFVNIDKRISQLAAFDFYEACDKNQVPWIEDNGSVISDPGHALEFCGLTAKLLLLRLKIGSPKENEQRLINKLKTYLPLIFFQNFKNGWNHRVGGICKSLDLIEKTHINTDMPWWNLPETMRAAILIKELILDSSTKKRLDTHYEMCKKAFFRNFINKDAFMMAYQTIDETGKPVNVIPATPDADPGYHTGLSLIDVFYYQGYGKT